MVIEGGLTLIARVNTYRERWPPNSSTNSKIKARFNPIGYYSDCSVLCVVRENPAFAREASGRICIGRDSLSLTRVIAIIYHGWIPSHKYAEGKGRMIVVTHSICLTPRAILSSISLHRWCLKGNIPYRVYITRLETNKRARARVSSLVLNKRSFWESARSGIETRVKIAYRILVNSWQTGDPAG